MPSCKCLSCLSAWYLRIMVAPSSNDTMAFWLRNLLYFVSVCGICRIVFLCTRSHQPMGKRSNRQCGLRLLFGWSKPSGFDFLSFGVETCNYLPRPKQSWHLSRPSEIHIVSHFDPQAGCCVSKALNMQFQTLNPSHPRVITNQFARNLPRTNKIQNAKECHACEVTQKVAFVWWEQLQHVATSVCHPLPLHSRWYGPKR